MNFYDYGDLVVDTLCGIGVLYLLVSAYLSVRKSKKKRH